MRKQLKYLERNAKRLMYLVDQIMDYKTAESGTFKLKVRHEDAHKIHQYWAKHHERSARTHSDYIQMVIDWECSRFTKPDKPLNARETLYKYYPHKEKEILPILEELGL